MPTQLALHTHTNKVCYEWLCVCVCVFTVKGDNAQTSSQSPSSSLAHIENEGNEINQDSLNRRRSRENRNTAAATVIAHKRVCRCVFVWGVCVSWVCVSCVRVRLGYVSARQSKVDSCCQLNHRQPPHTLTSLAHSYTFPHTHSRTLDYLCIDKYLSARQVELNF